VEIGASPHYLRGMLASWSAGASKRAGDQVLVHHVPDASEATGSLALRPSAALIRLVRWRAISIAVSAV